VVDAAGRERRLLTVTEVAGARPPDVALAVGRRPARAWREPLSLYGPAATIVIVQLLLFPMPSGLFLRGLVIGGLSALVSLGMALVYRSNRILNFAQGDLGGAPTMLVVMLMSAWGWSYWLAVPAGVVVAIALGAVVELAVIRRFSKAPRLILTVATLGLSQLLAAATLLLPALWGDRVFAPRVTPPFTLSWSFGGVIFGANDLLAMALVPLSIAALAWFLQRTDVGVAIRASAGSADRAGLLGVPVKRIQTLVWAVAGLLAFTATFLRAGILGVPVGPALGLGVLLRSLAALMMGRLTHLSAITASAVALGVLELGVGWHASSTLVVDPVLAVVVGVALLLQRRSRARGDTDATSSWQSAEEVRPIPRELIRVPEVRWVRIGFVTVVVAVAVVLPHLLSVDRSLKASAVLIYAILALSLVVLTGWAGQVSLGQVAFFAIGAVVGERVTTGWHADLTVALVVSAAAGGVAAVLVGLPTVRQRGLYLAVSTFAFALATTSYLLNPEFFSWVPSEHFDRLPLFGRVSLASPTAIYYVALGSLGLVVVMIRGIRHSRTGRVLIALRENERGTEAYGVSPVRAKLTAFAISGSVAGFAGCLFVYHQQAFGTGPYDPGQNFAVFTMAVIGGVASIPGALLGALFLRGTQWFLPTNWQYVATGLGVLLVLLVLPSGLGGLMFRVRDLGLRWVADRRGIVVPSMVADVAEHPPAAPPPIAGPAPSADPGAVVAAARVEP